MQKKFTVTINNEADTITVHKFGCKHDAKGGNSWTKEGENAKEVSKAQKADFVRCEQIGFKYRIATCAID